VSEGRREEGSERRETEGKKLGREGEKREEGGRVEIMRRREEEEEQHLNFTYPQNRCRKRS
jgi:hypothetical protein